jgi:PhzF family phenazine biosynthesis protein
MSSVAREMRHSETAFCIPLKDGSFELRWFTPEREVRLCGHATLATAHVLWEEGRLSVREAARFATLSGELTAKPFGRVIELDFPARPPSEVAQPSGLLDALGVSATWVGYDGEDYVVVVDDEKAVRACAPDFRALGSVEARGIMITAPSDHAETDFVSRFFAPRFGIDEDPATGSAHCCLTPLWAQRLGKTSLEAQQLSARGGRFSLDLAGDRVKLRGTCVTTLRGTLTENPPRANSSKALFGG